MRTKIKKKPEDQVIKYLLDKRKNPMEKVVWFGASDFTKFKDIKPNEILEALNKLESDKYISCSQIGQRQEFSIRLLNKASTYFDIKNKKEEDKSKERCKFWIPTIISIVSAVTSIISLYFSIVAR